MGGCFVCANVIINSETAKFIFAKSVFLFANPPICVHKR